MGSPAMRRYSIGDKGDHGLSGVSGRGGGGAGLGVVEEEEEWASEERQVCGDGGFCSVCRGVFPADGCGTRGAEAGGAR